MAAKRVCSVSSCDKPVLYRGLCVAHYDRWRKGKDLSKPIVSRGDPERFLKEVALKYRGKDCLLWPYSKANYGYGEIRPGGRKGRKLLVHRVVCEATRGPPPAGRNDAAHRCGNRLCVNPRHIRWATRTENVADTLEHGTRVRGERHPNAKLTEADVRKMRSLEGVVGVTKLAKRFGVSAGTVSEILSRKLWSWLE